MTDFHNHISNAGREVSLSAAEREKMRDTIISYMGMRPVRAPIVRTSLSPLSASFFSRAVAFAVAFAVIGSSAGISYAAESALPGDALYAVKVNINEPMRGALAVTPQAKAVWAMNVAATRATEAATLAAENKLSATTSAELQQSFVSHAREAAASIAERSQRDPSDGAELATRFEARLSEYERMLAAISATDGTGNGIASAIHGEREHVMALTTADASDTDTAHLHIAAQEGITAATELIPGTRAALSTTTAAQIASKLDQTNDTIASGQDLLAKDDRGQASGEFRKAIQVSERLSTFLQTSAAIHERTGLVITSADVPATTSEGTVREKAAAPIRATLMMAPAATSEAPRPQEGARAASEDDHEDDHGHVLSIPVPDL